ncbi:ADP,ATP carrier protein, putative [Pediculus humanus corporis]|uniref:ADP,ATP carrier protein, putative n=1 Tax=Pediculus humanus subsp. corporis TaxID=121224 RepID=E0VG59_PEDHC|nr:ADP,ATP carrier protein, putative [Pediculus humanus corporis]EEB12365.1 ADP,ATP carrier protein, putative [Pediculus humanus corporis]
MSSSKNKVDETDCALKISQEPYSAKSAYNYLKNIVVKNGFFALWRGNTASMARILPYASIQFTSHEQWKRILGTSNKDHNFRRFLAGSLAGITSQTLTYPLDLARARMAVTYDSEFATLKQVKEGLKGFYRGYVPTFLGVIPYAGASFFTYESLKIWYSDLMGKAKPDSLILLAFGAASGFCGQGISYPLDIVRRRMQTEVITKQNYQSIFGTLKTIYRTEGFIKGFFKGLSMNWIKGPIAVGISFATYDGMTDFLRRIIC